MTIESSAEQTTSPHLFMPDSVKKIGQHDPLPDTGSALVELDSLDVALTLDEHVLFFATDDTHVNTMLRIANHCPSHTFVVHATLDLHARSALDEAGVDYVIHTADMVEFAHADIALMGNDVGWEERLFILRCREKAIPTVSLQEATNVDFDGWPWRMQWVDVTFIQGVYALKRHSRQLMFLTGNPRFDDIQLNPLPEEPRVLINCNFTFGIGVDWGRAWVEQVIVVAKSLGLEYAVTVHPRDETDLSGIEHVLPSNAFKVHEQLAESSVLISRDSSLPYEAAMMGRNVIYYNSFNEPEYWLNNDDTGLIQQCYTPEDLKQVLSDTLQSAIRVEGKEQALSAVFTGVDGLNHARVAQAIKILCQRGNDWKTSDARAHGYFHTWLQMHLQNVWRPRIRQIAPLRWIWKCGKWLVGGYRRT